MLKTIIAAVGFFAAAVFFPAALAAQSSSPDYSSGVAGVTIANQVSSGSGGAINEGTINNGIMNSVFSGNRADLAGGAVFVTNLNGGVNNSRFTGNQASLMGGALYFNVLRGGISDSQFIGNSSASWGGAVYGTDLNSGISRSRFESNTGSRGGAISLTSLYGGLTDSYFIGNRATSAQGGAISLTTTLTGNIVGSHFLNNKAADFGGALYTPSLDGDIRNSEFSGNSGRSGGALYVRTFYGGIYNSTFENNSAVSNGGAATIDAIDSGGAISSSIFSGNSAGERGGAIFTSHLDNVVISDSSFTDNSADYGGAMFISTHLSMAPGSGGNAVVDLTLTASAGKALIFSGNRDSSGASSLYFGRLSGDSQTSASLYVSGAGNVDLNDPIRVDMTTPGPPGDTSFSFLRDTALGGGQFVWGGRNLISNPDGQAGFDFDSGRTLFLSNYTLTAGAATEMSVNLGAGHITILDLTNRNGNLAVLDFTNAAASSNLSWAAGSTFAVGRSLLASEGRYLLVDGYSGVLPNPGDINFVNTTEDKFSWEILGDQLWIYVTHTPDRSPAAYRPNVRRALWSLNQLISHSDFGLNMTDQEYQAFKDDIDTTPPEAGVSMGLIAMQTNNTVAQTALRNAVPFGPYHSASAFDEVRAIEAGSSAFSRYSNPNGPNNTIKHNAPTDTYSATFETGRAGNIMGSWRPAMAATKEALSPSAGGSGPANPSRQGLNYWMGYIGGFSEADTHSGYMGYDTTTNGVLLGFSGRAADNWLLGGYTGYTNTSATFDELRAKGTADGFHMGAFVNYNLPTGFSVTLDGLYSRFGNEVERNTAGLLNSATEYKQDVYGLGLEAAYEIALFEQGRLTPFAGARWTRLDQEAFTETGDVLSAHVQKAEADSYTTTVGASLAGDFWPQPGTVVTPSLELAWKHEYGDRYVITRGNRFTSPLVTGEAPILFDTYSLPRDRDMLQLGASVQARFSGGSGGDWGLKASYGLEVSDNYRNHSFFAGLDFGF